MTRDVLVIPPDYSLSAAWRIMCREGIRHLPVVRAGVLIGMLSDRDILGRSTLTKDGAMGFARGAIALDAMTSGPLETCASTADVSDVARMMIDLKIDAVPVVDDARLVGLVTSTDLLRVLAGRDQPEVLPFSFRLIEEVQSGASD